MRHRAPRGSRRHHSCPRAPTGGGSSQNAPRRRRRARAAAQEEENGINNPRRRDLRATPPPPAAGPPQRSGVTSPLFSLPLPQPEPRGDGGPRAPSVLRPEAASPWGPAGLHPSSGSPWSPLSPRWHHHARGQLALVPSTGAAPAGASHVTPISPAQGHVGSLPPGVDGPPCVPVLWVPQWWHSTYGHPQNAAPS